VDDICYESLLEQVNKLDLMGDVEKQIDACGWKFMRFDMFPNLGMMNQE
jgi:hypothetical protein